jgi:hypothetical protein
VAAGGEAQPLKGKLDQNGKRGGVRVRHGDAQGACNARNQRLPSKTVRKSALNVSLCSAASSRLR